MGSKKRFIEKLLHDQYALTSVMILSAAAVILLNVSLSRTSLPI
jgi:hypothetical protein